MKSTYQILGLHCAGCVSTVEKTLLSCEGVNYASVSLPLEKVTIDFENSVSFETLESIINDAGYTLIENDSSNKNKIVEKHQNKKRLIWILVFGIPLLIYAMVEMFLFGLISESFPSTASILIQCTLASIILYIGRHYYALGFAAFFRYKPDMNSLIMLGTGAAYIYSIVSSINILFKLEILGFEKLYFESAGVILMFITLGRYLEDRAKNRTTTALTKLLENAPRTAWIEKNNQWVEVSVNEIPIGAWIMVKPGGQIPLDGIVIEGHSFVDESSITGESVPIEKKIGDKVLGATINSKGKLIFQSEKLDNETIYARIIKLVEKAQTTKAPIQSIADKIASIFVPVVCIISILSSITWFILGQSMVFCMNIFITVLIIACPCALGLATPTAIVVGFGLAAERGIHFKSAKVLQKLEKLNTIVFDKTGTLTRGNMVVSNIYSSRTENDFLEVLCALEAASEHPFARAILNYGKEKNITYPECSDFKAVPGEGIIGSIGGQTVYVGNHQFLAKKKIEMSEDIIKKDEIFRRQGKSVIHCASGSFWVGLIAFKDEINPKSEPMIYQIKKRGIDIWMVTGDNKVTADQVAHNLGIKNIVAQVLPSDKSDIIKNLQAEGKIVVMVGDGINDAPAIAQADIGISIGSGTDVAIETSDIVLINQKIDSIIEAIDLSKIIIKKIKQNLFWAFAYNIIGIPIAMGIMYPINGYLLNPMLAGIAMAFSSISVVGNTLLLKKVN